MKKLLAEVEKDLDLISPELREWNISYFYGAKNRYISDLKIIESYYKDGKILEAGSVPCHLTYCLKKMGYPVIGIDIDPKRSEQFIEKHNLEIKKCDIEKDKLPFKNNTFDFIIFNEIFEHLRIDPISTMREINRILKVGGILMLATPNLYSLPKIIMFNLGRGFNNPYFEFEKLHKLGHMGHIREYSTKEVKQFLKNTGFQIIDVKYKSYNKINRRSIGPIINLIFKIIPRLNMFQIVISKKS